MKGYIISCLFPSNGRITARSLWHAVEQDVTTWLEQYLASGTARPHPALTGTEYKAAPSNLPLRVSSLAFSSGALAVDFLRRLNVLFDGRTTRLIIPSTPVVVFGPALIDPEAPVMLYAGRGAISLARYVGLAFPAPGEAVDVAALTDVGVVFGAVSPETSGHGRASGG